MRLLNVLWLALLLLMPVRGDAATILGDEILLDLLIEEELSITVGDKLFTDFGYASTGDMPSAAGVNVIPIMDTDGNFGIRFQGAFVDLASSPDGSDALITYKVSVLDDSMQIVGANLQGNPALLGDFGSISVVESFLPDVDTVVLEIFDDEFLGLQMTDTTTLDDPTSMLLVQKDISAIAVGEQGEGTATLSFVDQTFIQVPEPTALGLLSLGLAGLALAGTRRR